MILNFKEWFFNESYQKIWKPRFEKIESHREKSFSHLFPEGQDRIYLPITIKLSDFNDMIRFENTKSYKEISQAFQKSGQFQILDWKKGLAIDGRKNIWKIARALESIQENNLKSNYLSLKGRFNASNKMNIVISQNTHDIASMSTGKAWQSCNTFNTGEYGEKKYGITFKKMAKEVLKGGLVAYLIDEEDKNIKSPYARLMIRRYYSPTTGESLMACSEHDVYGINTQAFIDKVQKWISSKQKSAKFGMYQKEGGRWISSDSYEKFIPIEKITRKNENFIIDQIQKEHAFYNRDKMLYNVLRKVVEQGFNTISKKFWTNLKKIILNRKNVDGIEYEMGEIWKYNPNALNFEELMSLSSIDAYNILRIASEYEYDSFGIEKSNNENKIDKFNEYTKSKMINLLNKRNPNVKKFILALEHIDANNIESNIIMQIIETAGRILKSKIGDVESKKELAEIVIDGLEYRWHTYKNTDDIYILWLKKAAPLLQYFIPYVKHRDIERMVNNMNKYDIHPSNIPKREEYAENSGPPQGMHPPRQDPVVIAKDTKGGMPFYDRKPLPGNLKRMKKKMGKK